MLIICLSAILFTAFIIKILRFFAVSKPLNEMPIYAIYHKYVVKEDKSCENSCVQFFTPIQKYFSGGRHAVSTGISGN